MPAGVQSLSDDLDRRESEMNHIVENNDNQIKVEVTLLSAQDDYLAVTAQSLSSDHAFTQRVVEQVVAGTSSQLSQSSSEQGRRVAVWRRRSQTRRISWAATTRALSSFAGHSQRLGFLQQALQSFFTTPPSTTAPAATAGARHAEGDSQANGASVLRLALPPAWTGFGGGLGQIVPRGLQLSLIHI